MNLDQAEVKGPPQHEKIIAWFKTLPLWLELPGLRIVHACWHQSWMDVLTPLLRPDKRLTDEVILYGGRKGHPVFEALEVVCKGPEVALPVKKAVAASISEMSFSILYILLTALYAYR
jgi:hypothetical protein